MHKVITARQIAANRHNARLSTRPKTRAGKALRLKQPPSRLVLPLPPLRTDPSHQYRD